MCFNNNINNNNNKLNYYCGRTSNYVPLYVSKLLCDFVFSPKAC